MRRAKAGWFQEDFQMAPESMVAGGVLVRVDWTKSETLSRDGLDPPVALAIVVRNSGSGERSSFSVGGAGTVKRLSGAGGGLVRESRTWSFQVPGESGVKEARQVGRPEGSGMGVGWIRASEPDGEVTSKVGVGVGGEPR